MHVAVNIYIVLYRVCVLEFGAGGFKYRLCALWVLCNEN